MSLNTKTQLSFEYTLIFLVVTLIAVPSILLFKNYVYESNENIVLQNIDKLANELLNTATQIYYLGTPSRIVLSVEFPDKIENISIVEISPQEYYMVFNVTTSKGEKELLYSSKVPIKRSISITENNCYGSTQTSCNFYYFNESEIMPGPKSIRIEARGDGVYIEGI
ncbi:hypothetical protein HYY70_04640 [Candidatus Woesearchaeota archaeon]|nr:hypothetical protein [Candidatus Woesearchaeota archaeon]